MSVVHSQGVAESAGELEEHRPITGRRGPDGVAHQNSNSQVKLFSQSSMKATDASLQRNPSQGPTRDWSRARGASNTRGYQPFTVAISEATTPVECKKTSPTFAGGVESFSPSKVAPLQSRLEFRKGFQSGDMSPKTSTAFAHPPAATNANNSVNSENASNPFFSFKAPPFSSNAGAFSKSVQPRQDAFQDSASIRQPSGNKGKAPKAKLQHFSSGSSFTLMPETPPPPTPNFGNDNTDDAGLYSQGKREAVTAIPR